MYTSCMKRTQIYLDEGLDRRLRSRARKEQRSAAALIRDAVRTYLDAQATRPVGLARLHGTGKEIWSDEDVTAYIDQLREERH